MTPPFSYWLILKPLVFHELTHELTHALIHELTNKRTHERIHELTHELTHTITHELTHTITLELAREPHPCTHSYYEQPCINSLMESAMKP